MFSPIVDAGYVNLYGRDITERKRAEEALRESEERLRAQYKGIPVPTYTWQRVGEDFVLTDYNDAAEAITHGKVVDFVGRRACEMYRDRPDILENLSQCFAEETSIKREMEYRFMITGERKHLAVSYAFVPPNLVMVHTEDITERKRAEEALKDYSERLEEMVEERAKELRDAQEELVRRERLAVLGQLAGGVAHELRNPQTVISNAIHCLQTTLPDADETTKEYLEMISSEVRNSDKIVSDLLSLSRTKPAEREEIAVSDLVAQLWEKLPPPEKLKVTTEIAPDLAPLFVDPRQIGQVLVNLITNAYEAMPEGGRLTIKAEAEKDQVYLSIADTGCGISKENMKRLFKPLFTTKAQGIGAGLAVSKNLVEVNEGSIEVQSEESKGSTFTVILPTKEAQA